MSHRPAQHCARKSPCSRSKVSSTLTATTPAPAVVAWLSNPAPPVKPKTPAQILIEQIERGDVWNHAGEWQGRGPQPEKEDPTP